MARTKAKSQSQGNHAVISAVSLSENSRTDPADVVPVHLSEPSFKILHFSDVHLGSTAHGKINPLTGLNTRFEDFCTALKHCIDRALDEPADLVLFGGDAFPDATPPPYVQQGFAQQLRRLADRGIPSVLLVGNHDQHSQGHGGASLSIYRSLGVPHCIVGDRLETHRITTRSGIIQVVTLPWLTRSALLTRQETDGLSISEVNHLLIDRLGAVLEGEIRQLDPHSPAILLGHAMIDAATYGAERFLAAGKGFTIPLSLLARPEFVYVALGHVHRHQILCQKPLMAYSGSIERVDFGEEKEPKGYCWLEIFPASVIDRNDADREPDLSQSVPDFNCGVNRYNALLEFCALPSRRFLTITSDLRKSQTPQATLEKAIQKYDITETIVRVLYKINPEQLPHIDEKSLQKCLASAHSYTLVPELTALPQRSRLNEADAAVLLDPISALQAYLTTRPDLSMHTAGLLAATEILMQEVLHDVTVNNSPLLTLPNSEPNLTTNLEPKNLSHNPVPLRPTQATQNNDYSEKTALNHSHPPSKYTRPSKPTGKFMGKFAGQQLEIL
ncbi:MAG: exonuclease subunit SbcD [Pseudanabaena sp. ELA607]